MPSVSTPKIAGKTKRRQGPPSSRWKPIYAAAGVWLMACLGWLVIPPPIPDLTGLTPIGQEYFHPDHDLAIYLAGGVAAVAISTLLMFRNSKSPTTTPDMGSPTPTDRAASRLVDVLAILTILGFVVVVTPTELAERTFVADQYHHIAYYLLAPLQAYQHGLAMGSDVYTQYGSGWVLLFSLLSYVVPVDPVGVMTLLPLFGAAYFLSVYLLLRLLTRSAVWSWAGLLACLQWQLYCGTDLPLWSAPSSSVLRSPCDLAIAAALLFRPAFPRGSLVVAGVLGGMSLLFGTDTGIYLAAALAIYSVLSSIRPAPGRRPSGLAWLWGSYFTVAIVGFLAASRGTLLERRFWTGYFESLLEYGGGFGALPVADVLMQPAFALLMLAILLVYTFVFSRSAAAVLRGTASDRDLVLAFTSVVGFGTFTLFINRSHPYNLFHPIVPACVLATVLIAERFPDSGHTATLRQWISQRRISLAAVAGSALLLAINPNVWDYPSAAASLARFVTGSSRGPGPRHLAELMHKATLVKHVLRELEQGGNRVEIIGEDPTLWLLALDHPPMGRYCPALLINLSQIQRMEAEFQHRRPQVALVINYPGRYHANPQYFDSQWRLLYADPEFSIYASPEYREVEINSPPAQPGAAVPSRIEFSPRTIVPSTVRKRSDDRRLCSSLRKVSFG